tara:strand:- start:152 stop:418 length:267 start_codon:yes stop_codon:yes gene_type:complete
MSVAEAVKARIVEENPEALLMDGYDDAIVGVGSRCGQPTLVIYDYDKCIASLMEDGMTFEEAVDYFSFNCEGSWVGEGTPIILYQPDV